LLFYYFIISNSQNNNLGLLARFNKPTINNNCLWQHYNKLAEKKQIARQAQYGYLKVEIRLKTK